MKEEYYVQGGKRGEEDREEEEKDREGKVRGNGRK